MTDDDQSPPGEQPGEDELRLAVETAPVGLLIVDRTGRIVLVNAEVERIFGYSGTELIGRSVDLLVPADFRSAHPGHRAHFMAHPSERKMGGGRELFGARKDGSLVPVEIGLTPSKSPSGTLVIAAIADVSDRRNHEMERLRMEEELRRSQRLSALGEVTGAVAHDFNNLLTTIIAPLDLCSEYCEKVEDIDGRIRHELDVARASAARAVSLTRQLLAFSRRRIFSPVPINLNDIVMRSRGMLERLMRSQVALTFELAERLPSVVLDPALFDQVLLNLSLNAADAIPGKGVVHVRTGVAPNQWVFLEVTDTGTGMDEATRSRIFEPFFTTKKQGTGLGLSTVHGIVTQAEGQIEVESTPGAGTTFRVLFEPSREVPVALDRLDAPAPDSARVGGKGEKVLIVDDEDALRKVVARALDRSGYATVEAGNGEAALSLFDSSRGDFGLVITDIGLPDMDGIDLATRMEEIAPGTPILYTSGHSEEDVLKRFALMRPQAFLEKPFTVSALLTQVNRMVREVPPITN